MGMVPDLSGYTLGHYELRQRIGEGGMAVVYRGFQAKLGREVAIKVLPRSLAQNPQYEDRFKREAATAATLEHPHIVPIFDYGTERGISFVVMRLLVGGSLSDRLMLRELQKASLPSLAEVVRLLKQIGGALDYAHQRNVVHRDIKPSNIMFDEAANPFVVDFGIAKVLDATSGLTATGQTIGTPAFMAPEQWRAEMPVPATDQYAVGIMIYAVLTGRVPFESPTPYGLMHLHLHEVPQPPTTLRDDLPAGVNEVISRAIAKRAEDRYPTISDFADALEVAADNTNAKRTNFFTFDIPKRNLLPDTKTYMPSGPVPPVMPPVGPPPTQPGDGRARPAREQGRLKGWMILAALVVVVVLVAGLAVAIDEALSTIEDTPEATNAAAQIETTLPTADGSEPTLTATTLATPDIQASVQAGIDSTATAAVAAIITSPSTSPSTSPTTALTHTMAPTPTASDTPTRTPTATAVQVAEVTIGGDIWPTTIERRTATADSASGVIPLYAAPTIVGALVATVPNETVVGLLQVGEVWSLVFTPDAVGYTFTTNLMIDTDPTRFDNQLTRQATVVSVNDLAAYSQPTLSADFRFALQPRAEVGVLTEQGVFSLIVTDDNRLGWVFSSGLDAQATVSVPQASVEATPIPAPPIQWPDVIEPRAALVVSTNLIAMYAAPSLSADVVTTLLPREMVGLLAEDGLWSLVYAGDAVGFVLTDMVLIPSAAGMHFYPFMVDGVNIPLSTDGPVYLFEEPDTSAAPVIEILRDTNAVVMLYDDSGDYGYILLASGNAGWLPVSAFTVTSTRLPYQLVALPGACRVVPIGTPNVRTSPVLQADVVAQLTDEAYIIVATIAADGLPWYWIVPDLGLRTLPLGWVRDIAVEFTSTDCELR